MQVDRSRAGNRRCGMSLSRGGAALPCSSSLYPLVLAWIEALGLAPHATGAAALAVQVTALLTAQSLRPASRSRALLSSPAVPARQRFKRLARGLDAPWLTPVHVTAAVVPAVVALYPAATPVLVLDGVRCGPWETLTLGLALPGRVQILATATLPVPWPKGQYAATVQRLLLQVDAAWPASAPRPHLVADRAFPSTAFFRLLDQRGWGYTVRLRAPMAVTVADTVQTVRQLLATATPESWTLQQASYGQAGAAVPGQLVVGRGLPVLRWHQRDAGSARARQRRGRARAHDAGYARADRPSAAAQTDAWVVLFTTEQHWRPAVQRYAQRYPTEGSYRDLQSGWDGRHGWELDRVMPVQPRAEAVDALWSLALLAQLLQQWLGCGVGQPGPTRWLPLRWTVRGRLSIWARGRAALAEEDPVIQTWVATRLAAGLPLLRPLPPRRLPRPARLAQRCAAAA
jgi:hypothetical protein